MQRHGCEAVSVARVSLCSSVLSPSGANLSPLRRTGLVFLGQPTPLLWGFTFSSSSGEGNIRVSSSETPQQRGALASHSPSVANQAIFEPSLLCSDTQAFSSSPIKTKDQQHQPFLVATSIFPIPRSRSSSRTKTQRTGGNKVSEEGGGSSRELAALSAPGAVKALVSPF